MRRAVAHKWTCQRSGDCCLGPSIVCTPAEVTAMQTAQWRPLTVAPIADRPGLVSVLTPEGCPYLGREMDGRSTCTIYEHRPYSCRRFMCLRPDPATEPYEVGGPLGCRNLSDRLDTSLHALEFYRSNQRRAQRAWAEGMGWHKGMA